MANALFRPEPPTALSPLRRPAPASRPEARLLGGSPWSPPSSPASLTPLLDAIGRWRLQALAPRADAAALVPGSPRKAPPPGVGRGGGLPPGLTATLGRRALPKALEAESGCICQRAHAVVLCHVCGWYSRCRLMKPCREHPNTRFLLDLAVCPRCRAPSYQMDECDLNAQDLPPCPLLMPEPSHGPPSLSRRSTSPEAPEGRGAAAAAAAAAGVATPAKRQAGLRTRMRPPLQSDSHGMQRKLRDRFAQSVPRTPSGLPLPYGEESYGAPQRRRPADCHHRGSGAEAGLVYPADNRRRF